MDIRYRKAQLDDLLDVCAMVERVKQDLRAQGSDQWDENYPTSDILEGDIRRGEMTMGFADGKLAVLYTLNDTFDPEYAEGRWAEPEKPFRVLHRLCVEPSLQGTGVGKRTMDQVEVHAGALGAEYVRLDHIATNESAKRLYEGRGYRAVGSIDLWDKGTFILMEKKL